MRYLGLVVLLVLGLGVPQVTATADVYNQVNEFNESNNSRLIKFAVKNCPP